MKYRIRTTLFLLLLNTLCVGCADIGRRVINLSAEPDKAPNAERKGPVIVILLEGVRADAFARYRQALSRADHEPNWRSGLSTMALDGFSSVSAHRAEAPAGANVVSSTAEILTAAPPSVNGLVGNRFLDRSHDGVTTAYNFRQPLHASGTWQTSDGQWPSEQRETMSQSLLNVPTWLTPLSKSLRVGSSYLGLADAGRLIFPENLATATLPLLDANQATLAAPLLDQAAFQGASQLLSSGYEVVVVPFRQARALGCFRPNALCDANAAELSQLQEASIKAFDGYLWQVLSTLKIEQPNRYQALSLVVVGTHGIVDRAVGAKAGQLHVVNEERLRGQLGAFMPDQDCRDWFSANAGDDLSIVLDSAVARLYLPSCMPGQCHNDLPLRCLGEAVRKLTQVTQWASGAAWRTHQGHPGAEQGRSIDAVLRPAFAQSVREYRRARLLAKIRLAIDGPDARRAGDAVIYASRRWVFSEQQNITFAQEGGLADAAMQVPLLVANRRIDPAASAGVRTAPLELADVGPTVYSLLGRTDVESRFSRPPILRWRSSTQDTLEFVKADRHLRGEKSSGQPTILWSEKTDAIEIGVRESSKLWPPLSISVGLGELEHQTDADTGQFPEEAPCSTSTDDGARFWRCSFPVDRGSPKSLKARVKRSPSPSSDGDWTSEMSFRIGGSRPVIKDAVILCADTEEIVLQLSIESTTQPRSVTAYFARERRSSQHPIAGAGASADVSGWTRDCEGPSCLYRNQVKIPLRRDTLLRLRWADRLMGSSADVITSTRAEWAADNQGTSQPLTDWMMVRVCTETGLCAKRRVSSDLTYEVRAAKGCQP